MAVRGQKGAAEGGREQGSSGTATIVRVRGQEGAAEEGARGQGSTAVVRLEGQDGEAKGGSVTVMYWSRQQGR